MQLSCELFLYIRYNQVVRLTRTRVVIPSINSGNTFTNILLVIRVRVVVLIY